MRCSRGHRASGIGHRASGISCERCVPHFIENRYRWYPSSKTCSSCDHVQPIPLQARVFVYEACGNNCNRDLNAAAINLASVPKDRVRMASPELTPDQEKEPTPEADTGNKF